MKFTPSSRTMKSFPADQLLPRSLAMNSQYLFATEMTEINVEQNVINDYVNVDSQYPSISAMIQPKKVWPKRSLSQESRAPQVPSKKPLYMMSLDEDEEDDMDLLVKWPHT